MPDTRATVCDRCERLISRASKVCPYCGVQRAGWRVAELLREWIGARSVVSLLLAANVIVFVVSLVLSGPAALRFQDRGLFDFLGPRFEVAAFLGVLDPRAVKHDGEVWRLLTSAFLHAGVLHLAFNMSWLRSIGTLLEEELGSFRFAIVYLGSALAGSVACLVMDQRVLGASGAVFGLIGAGWGHGRRRGGVWGAQVRKQFLAWAIGGVVFTLLMSGTVSAPGHFGGLAGGVALGWLLSPTTRRRAGTNREGRWMTLAGGLLLACVPISFALAIGFGLAAPSAASIPFRIGGREHLDRWPLEPLDLARLGAPGWTIDVPRGWVERGEATPNRIVLDGAVGMNLVIVVTQEGERLRLAQIAEALAGASGWTRLDPANPDTDDEELDGETSVEGGERVRFHLRRLDPKQLLLVRSNTRSDTPTEWRVLFGRVIQSLRSSR